MHDSAKFLVLKAPNLVYSYTKLPQVFSSIKIVYMVRDIRDVVASTNELKRVPILQNQMARIFASTDLATIFPQEFSLLHESDLVVAPHIKMALVAKIKMGLVKYFIDNGMQVTTGMKNLLLSLIKLSRTYSKV